MYYDRNGNEIDDLEFGKLFADKSYQRLAHTTVFPTDTGFEVCWVPIGFSPPYHGVRLNTSVDIDVSAVRQGILISTVWLGLDHGIHTGRSKPIIFETMVFDNFYPGADEIFHEVRASTEEHAMKNHREGLIMVMDIIMSRLHKG